MCKCVPSQIDLRVVHGTNSTFDFYLTDGCGRPIDITGKDVKFTVKDVKGGTTKITKTNSTGQHTEPTKGMTTFSIVPADWTEAQTVERVSWVYEIRRIDGTNEYVHLEGDFVVDREV